MNLCFSPAPHLLNQCRCHSSLHIIHSSSSSIRRHHRRRLLEKTNTATTTTSITTGNNPFSQSSELQLVLNPSDSLKTLLNSPQSKLLSQFLESSRDAYEDLKTLVVLDPNQSGSLIISCRRSTVNFVGALSVSIIVFVFTLRALLKLGSLVFRQSYGNSGKKVVYRRDRSLGGKLVPVAEIEQSTGTNNKSRSSNILDSFDNDEYDDYSGKTSFWAKPRRRRKEAKLPKWWPVSSQSQILFAVENKDEYQRMANRLIRAIMDNKMAGKDILEDDILQLRYICKTSGLSVTIPTANTRDSLYRTSVDFVLNYCESMENQSDFILIGGEDPREFIAGLADNIELENARAARMVSAAVAARTRSRFLQAWALEMQDKHLEAEAELQKICFIHRVFPPDTFSPEMEMVARGLQKHLKLEQREHLMNTLITVCGEETHRSLAEALGLPFYRKLAQEDVNNHEESMQM